MGKYMRKSKPAGEAVALMDVSHSSLGVLTRAKSLALQKSSSSSSSLPSSPPLPQHQQLLDGSGPYLQLRSRRLQKRPPIVVIRSRKRTKLRKKTTCVESPNPNSQKLDSPVGSLLGSRVDGSYSGSIAESAVSAKKKEMLVGEKELDREVDKDLGVETSSGENLVELKARERTTRESTPTSLVRDSESVRNLGSSTRPNRGVMDISRREETLSGLNLPTTHEVDEFFSGAEEEQQRQFIEKYNFDPVNEKPLAGRYEWTKIEH